MEEEKKEKKLYPFLSKEFWEKSDSPIAIAHREQKKESEKQQKLLEQFPMAERMVRNKRIALMLGYTYYPYNTAESVKEESVYITYHRTKVFRIHERTTFGWVKGDRTKVGTHHKNPNPPDRLLARTHKDLRYFDSWNWLMTAVEFVNSVEDYEVVIRKNSTEIYKNRTNRTWGVYGNNEKINTWLSVSNFAEWYLTKTNGNDSSDRTD